MCSAEGGGSEKTFFAIRNAISYTKNNNIVKLIAPATPENILNSLNS